ncbi:MAG TPA: hypothetical protein VGR70_03920 [Stellaceae bacterium]|nr:hypothetical protein [Stellaceae bacterium]
MDDHTDRPGRLTEDHGKATAAPKVNRAPRRDAQLRKIHSEAWRAERDLHAENIRRELARIAAVGRRHPAAED